MTMRFDFDTIYDRRIPSDIKYTPVKGAEGAIPMWIADMDFKCPLAVREALNRAAERGIFGYTDTDDAYDSAVVSWYSRRMGWKINPAHILKMPCVMFAIASAIRALTEKGDGVMICQPVYHPFASVVTANERRLVVSELRLRDGKYYIDFEDFENKLMRENVRLFLLCSPHNPVGRVWTREELLEIGRRCLKHGVFIVSDEIHSDFIYPGSLHTPIASLSEELAECCVTCTSPTKTFNLAGLQAANIVISNPAIREKIRRTGLATGYSNVNSMAIAATKAAYLGGEDWFDALLCYLAENVALAETVGGKTDGKIRLIKPDGTYLLWLDCRRTGASNAELYKLFLNRAGVRIHKGTIFGAGGSGFMRMNVACPKSVLLEALDRIETATKGFA